MSGKLLKIGEFADRAGISRSLAYELVRAGSVPSIRLSERAVRVPESALEAWIEQNTRAAIPATA
jgi:excisionase family DNA binding protein